MPFKNTSRGNFEATVMNETQKPFACAREGCKMAFTNEDHLNVHKKKHDMALHLGIDNQNNAVVADQTPTPTRFIRNCEEVGLFQDLQNVNPFDETFRKATELAKSGSLHIPETSVDDSLHTPHIFPHIEEGNNISKFSRNISNEPEFTVTTIDHDLLKLSDKNSNDAISNKSKSDLEDDEVLSLTNDSRGSDECERNTFLAQSDPVISNHSRLISKDSLISHNVPTAIPISTSLTNPEVSPAVVNNLSDIIKQNCSNKAEGDGEETIKAKLKEALKNRVKTEESESDDCDTMVIHDIESSPLFTSSVSPRLIKTAHKRVNVKHSTKENHKNNIDNCTTGKSKQIFASCNRENKNSKNVKKAKLPVTQSQLERQREVNRAAQIRSREKKKYWINQMETEIEILKEEKKELWVENQNLKSEILWLKTMLLYHKDCPVARDPQITEEINQLVKVSQEEQQKKMQKNPVSSKKVVSIRPNPASIIAVTPVPVASSVLVQVPASVAKPVSVLTPAPISVSMDSSSPVKLSALPALKAKPPTPTAASEQTMISTPTTVMPKLIPKSTASSSTQKVTAQNSLTTAVTISPNLTSNLTSDIIMKLANDARLSPTNSKSSARQSKIVKVNKRLKVVHKKDRKLQNIKANPAQIISLPNTVLPDDNYFILAKPKNVFT